jgi:hypothetical protein
MDVQCSPLVVAYLREPNNRSVTGLELEEFRFSSPVLKVLLAAEPSLEIPISGLARILACILLGHLGSQLRELGLLLWSHP